MVNVEIIEFLRDFLKRHNMYPLVICTKKDSYSVWIQTESPDGKYLTRRLDFTDDTLLRDFKNFAEAFDVNDCITTWIKNSKGKAKYRIDDLIKDAKELEKAYSSAAKDIKEALS